MLVSVCAEQSEHVHAQNNRKKEEREVEQSVKAPLFAITTTATAATTSVTASKCTVQKTWVKMFELH